MVPVSYARPRVARQVTRIKSGSRIRGENSDTSASESPRSPSGIPAGEGGCPNVDACGRTSRETQVRTRGY